MWDWFCGSSVLLAQAFGAKEIFAYDLDAMQVCVAQKPLSSTLYGKKHPAGDRLRWRLRQMIVATPGDILFT